MQVHHRTPHGEYDVSVEMGRASPGASVVGLDPRALDDQGRIELRQARVEIHPMSVGNPHCVIFQEDLSDAALEDLGPALATHPALANGTNVQLAWPADAGTLRIRIWERGVGPTRASGTSSCAAAAAAVNQGMLQPGPIDVLMDGGRLEVLVSPQLDITLRGPVREVCVGSLNEGFLASLTHP
jgi:diaminopimelate epimerase